MTKPLTKHAQSMTKHSSFVFVLLTAFNKTRAVRLGSLCMLMLNALTTGLLSRAQVENALQVSVSASSGPDRA